MNKGEVAERHIMRDEDLCKHESHIDLYNEMGDSFSEILVNKSLADAYEENFGEAIKEYNAHQKQKCRRMTIEKYMKSVESDVRGNPVRKRQNKKLVIDENADHQGKRLQYEIGSKVGNCTERIVNDDGTLTMTEELPRDLQTEINREYVATFEERNPNLKIVKAAIHGDEFFTRKNAKGEPIKYHGEVHSHISFIPLGHNYERGLSVQNSIGRALGEMGFHNYAEWENSEQKALEDITKQKYKDYCLAHPDYYQEHGDLDIYHPVADGNKQGGEDAHLAGERQELAEKIDEAKGIITQAQAKFDEGEQYRDNNKAKSKELAEREHALQAKEYAIKKREQQLEDAERELTLESQVLDEKQARNQQILDDADKRLLESKKLQADMFEAFRQLRTLDMINNLFASEEKKRQHPLSIFELVSVFMSGVPKIKKQFQERSIKEMDKHYASKIQLPPKNNDSQFGE